MSPYECASCSEGFTSLAAFDAHLDTDWNDPRGTTVCLDPESVGLTWQAKVSGVARGPNRAPGKPAGWSISAGVRRNPASSPADGSTPGGEAA